MFFRTISPLRTALPRIIITYYRRTPGSFQESAGHDNFFQRNICFRIFLLSLRENLPACTYVYSLLFFFIISFFSGWQLRITPAVIFAGVGPRAAGPPGTIRGFSPKVRAVPWIHQFSGELLHVRHAPLLFSPQLPVEKHFTVFV